MKKLIALVGATLLLGGCTTGANSKTVYLATHDSFAISEELTAKFEAESGFQLEIIRMGDTGSLVSKLAVTKDSPVADAFYGLDNTFMSVAKQSGFIAGEAKAINFSDVCLNYDRDWFSENEIAPPGSWRELTNERYSGLTVLTNPLYSSPGLAFLATTYAGFESEAEVIEFWKSLRNNEVKIAASWEDAYFVDFTRYGGKYPIVLSYASSPAAEVKEDGTAGSAALLNDCFRQTEFAGLLANAKNPAGADALVDFLLSDSFQSSLPEAMYVYPVNKSVPLPETWSKFAKQANSIIGENLDIAANREQWLASWQEVFAD